MTRETPSGPTEIATGSGRIRIAALVSTMPTGGAERVTLTVLTRLDPARFDTEVYFLKEPGTVGETLIKQGIRCYSRLWKHRYDPFIILRLSRRLREFSPDILLTLNCHRNAKFWAGLCSLFVDAGKKVIAVHNTGTMNSERNFNFIDRLFLSSTECMIALSDSHARYLERVDGIDPKRITIIENGIVPELYEHADVARVKSIRDELKIEDAQRIIIMVAGLRPEKAHESLLRAASILAPSHPNIRILIVGDGPRRQKLEQLADQLRVRKHVAFLGERQDIPDLLHLADVLVLPSHPAVETLPLVVMEAMAAGVPVIASRVGSIPDMIQDGVNGKLISPAHAEELAAAIMEVLNNPPLAETMAIEGKRTVREKYTLENMILNYAALFERLARST